MDSIQAVSAIPPTLSASARNGLIPPYTSRVCDASGLPATARANASMPISGTSWPANVASIAAPSATVTLDRRGSSMYVTIPVMATPTSIAISANRRTASRDTSPCVETENVPAVSSPATRNPIRNPLTNRLTITVTQTGSCTARSFRWRSCCPSAHAPPA